MKAETPTSPAQTAAPAARPGFTVLELAITVLVLSGVAYIATFREHAIVGGGILASGALLCLAQAARARGWRPAAAVLTALSVMAALWMVKACSGSIAAARHAAPQRQSEQTPG